ncbi:GntR family transcriptional regulator [Candidatus Hydrogenedentota bacterium]
MDIQITLRDGVPIYRQIANQIKYLAASERLKPGDEVPAIRVLAEQILVNPNTVARAYRELEIEGIVQKRRGAGTYISEIGSPLAKKEKLSILAERADALLTEARQMNFNIDETIKILRKRDAAMGRKEGKSEDGRRRKAAC